MVEVTQPPVEHLQAAPAQTQEATKETGHHWEFMENFEGTPRK